jgi:hydrogenase maturation protein HypF
MGPLEPPEVQLDAQFVVEPDPQLDAPLVAQPTPQPDAPLVAQPTPPLSTQLDAPLVAHPATPPGSPLVARHWKIEGRVQGVGYRPFVFRLAHEYGLHGWVCNGQEGVEVVAEGPEANIVAFGRDLVSRAPGLARPERIVAESISPPHRTDFRIRASDRTGEPQVHLPPDQSVCGDCLSEIHDPLARRFQYPFTNCTQCGPRYTIIRALPYDRCNTTLAAFPLCPACASEYADPLDRRFHAQPLACPRCGPQLYWHAGDSETHTSAAALDACVAALRNGQIVAVRGVGGYHLMCDATNAGAVEELRVRKHRPAKPLALMVPFTGPDGLAAARQLVSLSSAESAALLDPARPIVLAKCGNDALAALAVPVAPAAHAAPAPPIAPVALAAPTAPPTPVAAAVAPGLTELGLMLPYSPLHHLLLEQLGTPLVATSANLSGEPVLTQPDAVEQRLSGVADAFLHHNRPIERPADDPVVRLLAGRIRPIRLGRGTAPLELPLHTPIERPLLALGAFLKTTVSLAWEDRVVVSPHIGDLGSPHSRRVLHEVATDLQALYGVRAESVTCDAHPDFPTHRWARSSGLPVTVVLHHYAHASAVAGEYAVKEPMLCFAWDGIGYGEDGTLWGGEALYGSPGQWRRVGSWRPFSLPGGARAVKQPWRTALSLCWESGRHWPDAPANIDPLLRRAFDTRWRMPQTSAVGRLFDAAAALLGLVSEASFEAQAPMQLENLANNLKNVANDSVSAPVELPLHADAHGVLRTDWAPLLDLLLDRTRSTAERVSAFHASLAHALVRQTFALLDRFPFKHVGLCGGVFQNRLLTEAVHDALGSHGFEVLIPARLPLNDAGISYGQVIETAARVRPT